VQNGYLYPIPLCYFFSLSSHSYRPIKCYWHLWFPGGERAETETETETPSASCFRFAARFSSGNWRGGFLGGFWIGWVDAGREVLAKVEGGGGGDVMDRRK